jgi:MFS superfamily sulfate permease-like transporter
VSKAWRGMGAKTLLAELATLAAAVALALLTDPWLAVTVALLYAAYTIIDLILPPEKQRIHASGGHES